MKRTHNFCGAILCKALIIFTCLMANSNKSFSQSAPKWSVEGNTATSSDFLGTTNNEDLIFKTNNTTAFKIKANGNIILKSLDGLGNGIITIDNNGKLIHTPFTGDANQVLLGDGTFGALPSGLWTTGPSGKIYYTGGKVGIGTTTPNFKLDVDGDVRITQNLYLQGELVINDKIQTPKQMKAGSIVVDSLLMDSTKAIYGITNFKDEVKLANKLSVNGNATIGGDLKTFGSLTFAGDKKVSYTPASGAFPQMIGWGTPIEIIGPTLPYCFEPSTPSGVSTANVFSGMLYSAGTNSTGQIKVLRSGFDGANGIIDVAGIGGTTNPSLLLNYYCGMDIYMCTGTGGGFVRSGKNFEVGSPVRDVNIAMNISVDQQTGLFLTTSHATDYNYNTKIAVNRDKTKALAVYNNSSNAENFVVFGDGKVGIGTNTPEAQTQIINSFMTSGIGLKVSSRNFDNETGILSEMELSESKAYVGGIKTPGGTLIENFVVYADGHVRARDIKVTLNPLTHGDFVFEKSYELMPLNELENYVKSQSHLPNIPSTSELQKNNGISLGEMSEKQLIKIEELTLYIIEMNKKLVELSKIVETQKEEIKALKN